jgi:secreted trypsin-like serine protease
MLLRRGGLPVHVALLCCVASWVASSVVAVPESALLEDNKDLQQRALIINGKNAVKGRYPYFVTLDHYGGGALIAPDIVLTGGHCKPRKRDNVRPVVGTYSFKHDKDHEEFDIVDMVRHPGFVYVNDNEFIFDFTLLKLSGQSSSPVIKINRNNQLPAHEQEVVAMGMGDTAPDRESRPDILKETTLNAIPNTLCAEAVDPDRDFLTYQGHIFPSMMCTTGGPTNERDAW